MKIPKFIRDIFGKKKSLYEYDHVNINWIDDFHEGLAWFRLIGDGHHRYGFINKKFEVVIAPIFFKLQKFSNGLAPYWNGASWGFINKNGLEVIRPRYYDIGEGFTEGLCPVKENKSGKYGFITKKGLYKIPPMYQLAFNFYQGRAQIVIDNNFYFIDKNGKIITESLHRWYGV